ncbi:DMT family transporter [Marivivens marinus]|uniref:DMT family transporter n=1 Tax=Marivivens marinus TaxID=3110173 RepID=UPI003B8467BB
MVQTPDPLGPPIVPRPPRQLLEGNTLAVLSMVAWAAGFPAADYLLQTWDPLMLITARLALAVGILIPIWVMLDGPLALIRARWGRGTVVGGIAFGLGAYLLLLAQDYTDPVTVAVIAAACPIAATVIEMIFEDRRLTMGFIIGLLASVVGGAIAAGGGPVLDLGLGAGMAVAACFLFSWGSWATVRDFPDLSPVGRTTITLAGGLMFMGCIAVGARLTGAVATPPGLLVPGTLMPLLIYAFGSMALSQFLWLASVGRLGVAVASFHINVAPCYVMLILVALGQDWSWAQAVGAAIVASGVVIAQRGPR